MDQSPCVDPHQCQEWGRYDQPPLVAIEGGTPNTLFQRESHRRNRCPSERKLWWRDTRLTGRKHSGERQGPHLAGWPETVFGEIIESGGGPGFEPGFEVNWHNVFTDYLFLIF